MAYCAEPDLVLGDVLLPTWLVKSEWVNAAAEEMDAKLGFIYMAPVRAVGGTFGDLAEHEKLLLKNINLKLASGRIILALDSGGEDERLHAYGLRLVTEALNDLMAIANGVVQFPDAALNETTASNGPSVTPGVHNADDLSLVDAWSDTVLRGETRRAYTGRGVPAPVVFPNPSFYPVIFS